MFDYQEELGQRLGRFRKYLAPMHDRAHNEPQGPCFLIFEERHGEDINSDHLVELKEAVLERVLQAFERVSRRQPEIGNDGKLEAIDAD